MKIFVSRNSETTLSPYPTIAKAVEALEAMEFERTVIIRGEAWPESILLNEPLLPQFMPTFYEHMSEFSYKPLKCTRG